MYKHCLALTLVHLASAIHFNAELVNKVPADIHCSESVIEASYADCDEARRHALGVVEQQILDAINGMNAESKHPFYIVEADDSVSQDDTYLSVPNAATSQHPSPLLSLTRETVLLAMEIREALDLVLEYIEPSS